MSLINQMLKDLDARKQQEANNSTQEVEVVVCHTAKRFRYRIVVVLVAVIFLCAGGGWWLFKPRTEATLRVSLLPQPAEIVDPIAVAPQPVAVVDAVDRVAVVVEEQVAPQFEPLVVPELSQPVKSPVLPDRAVPVTVGSVMGAPVDRAVARSVMPADVALEDSPSISSARMVIEPPSLAEQAQQLRIEGRALIQQRRYQAGAQRLNQALQIDHSSAQPWQELVRVCVQAGDLPSAMDAVTRGSEAYPNDIGLRVYRARLIVDSGDYGSALAVLQMGPLPTIEASSDYYALLASVLQQQGRFSEAGEQYALLTTTYPHRGDWWFGRAVCADQLGSAQHAKGYYQQAITCRNLNPQLKQFALQQLTRLGKG